MIRDSINTVIIGGGQAGLAMSYHLGQLGCEHVILERQRVAERWRSQRWDTLAFQFPNWTLQLPHYVYQGPARMGSRPATRSFASSRAMPTSSPRHCAAEPP